LEEENDRWGNSSSSSYSTLRYKGWDSLGVWWEWKEDPWTEEVYLKVTMTRIVQQIKEAYAEAMGKLAKLAKTPGYPVKCLKKATEVEEEVKNMQYQLIVRKSMYYMAKVRLELANPFRELARQMVKPNKEHWKAVKQAVGYVATEHYQGVIFWQPKKL